ncbi:glutamate synthase-related protein [Tumebacillus permanentifrigoris]|uniref:Glutamate synthase domain-containing protein 2 n=1 Tax=Tumebacillus permanentifrigoris TaxID=378543 RepID=A0A316DAP7_9BACL|nr:glutamate synthase-related protein [Tumebacillus permanentifrigoris]PWK14369.1 glutamate synthase domain-containing protein 2 [Tumebacillus permanentifrigoris]
MANNNLGKKLVEEHDACGIVAAVETSGQPTHENVQRILEALIQMNHRAGFIDGEGDGTGILIDVPRKLWTKKLMKNGLPGVWADHEQFGVAHLFVPKTDEHIMQGWMEDVRRKFADNGLAILLEQTDAVNTQALGPKGRQEEPLFWQLAFRADEQAESPAPVGAAYEALLFRLTCAIEASTPIHVCSLSPYSVVYKVRGSAECLLNYYPDLQNPELRSAATVGHNRYSTNTSTVFERVQPFSLLGHNGEINTIKRLREEAEMLGIQLVEGGSDSQDMNRTIEGLIAEYGFSLFEAMEMIFPPIVNEIKNFNSDLQDLYMFYRSAWGPFAQGPAGIVSRYGRECLFGVDALGLRPLWRMQTETSTWFSSEQGVVPLREMIAEPRPLAPGEKIGIKLTEQGALELPYHELQVEILQRASKRYSFANFRRSIKFGAPRAEFMNGELTVEVAKQESPEERERLLAAFGWEAEHLDLVDHQSSTGMEPIRSLGYDGPLAILSSERQNLADYFKESVAVVTNPAIDREREIEHFSTRVVVGPRPSLLGHQGIVYRRVELQTPLLLGGHRRTAPLSRDLYRPLAHKLGTYLFEDLLREFEDVQHAVAVLNINREHGENVPEALQRLTQEAVEAVVGGAHVLVLDDRFTFRHGAGYLDPHLITSAVHLALKNYPVAKKADNLRRRVSLVLRSAGLRNLHDIVIAIGLGADSVNPYLLWELASHTEPLAMIKNLYDALQKGLEKVISTLGIHELRGYDRLFSSIGFHPELAAHFGTPNFYGSDQGGLSFTDLEKDAVDREALIQSPEKARVARGYHVYPRLWKLVSDVAQGSKPYEEYTEKVQELEAKNPISLRHLLAPKVVEESLRPALEKVDVSVGQHSLPFLISSMSFGSQNETAFRAYAEAAYRLDMISLNGEGGEIKDMIGKYPNHRGMQIASGRFGVNIELLNSANLLEIKIGQGAKPGEGGHLPGTKVSTKVAAARNAQPGTDLISPSNNHDIYSIEDLAQMIDELKIANPNARVAVKVPVVPGIGTIAVGVAKAGADVITVSGYDGGTGAARAHALRHVGLPTEIGVKIAHEELVASGLRHLVELWADGGIKNGLDAMKMILLGANRIGFGTLAMVAVGCTACRGCHKDTCHVGIATQMDSVEEAKEKGLKMFVPRELDQSIDRLERFFSGIGHELKQWTAKLGATRTQDLVGRADLLEQVKLNTRLDLSGLLKPCVIESTVQVPAVRLSSVGVNSLTERMSMEAVTEMAAGGGIVSRNVEGAITSDRVLGSHLSGNLTRHRFKGEQFQKASVRLDDGTIAGNGFAAYNTTGVHFRVQGGAQDGLGKTSYGGKVIVLKGLNKNGERLNGSAGKGLGYGAQRGLFIVQGVADSRAGIRLSGADMIFGQRMTEPLHDEYGMLGARSQIKGFAFEYMTNGRALVMGDPGPWICSGMTGGAVYLRLQPELGLTQQALRRRIAKGAKVSLVPLDRAGIRDVEELLTIYKSELLRSGQTEEAAIIEDLLISPAQNFVMIKPGHLQTDQDIATE